MNHIPCLSSSSLTIPTLGQLGQLTASLRDPVEASIEGKDDLREKKAEDFLWEALYILLNPAYILQPYKDQASIYRRLAKKGIAHS